MVIVNCDLSVKSVGLGGLIILVVEFAIFNDRCLEVGYEGEREGVVIVCCFSSVTVVDITLKSNGISGVVLKIVFPKRQPLRAI